MEKTPYIGQMDRKILVQKETFVRASTGEQKPTLATVSEPFAYMQEQTGSEDVEGKVRHLITRSYTIRYNAEIAANGFKYKVVDAGVSYDIYHVKEIGRRSHLQLLVTSHE